MAKKKHWSSFFIVTFLASLILLEFSTASVIDPDHRSTSADPLAAGNEESSMTTTEGDQLKVSTGQGLGDHIEKNAAESSTEQPKNNTLPVAPSTSPLSLFTTSNRNHLEGASSTKTVPEIVEQTPATRNQEVTQSSISASSLDPTNFSEIKHSKAQSSPTSPTQPTQLKNDDDEVPTAIDKPDATSLGTNTSSTGSVTSASKDAVTLPSTSTTIENISASYTKPRLHLNNNSSGSTSTVRPSTLAGVTVASTPSRNSGAQVLNNTNKNVTDIPSANAKNESGAPNDTTPTSSFQVSTQASSSTMSASLEQNSAILASSTTTVGQGATTAPNLAPSSVSEPAVAEKVTVANVTTLEITPTTPSTVTSPPPNKINETEAATATSVQGISTVHNATNSTEKTPTTQLSTTNQPIYSPKPNNSSGQVTSTTPKFIIVLPKTTSIKPPIVTEKESPPTTHSTTTTTTTTSTPNPTVVPTTTSSTTTTTQTTPRTTMSTTQTTMSTTLTTKSTTLTTKSTTLTTTTAKQSITTKSSEVTKEVAKSNQTTSSSANMPGSNTPMIASLGTIIILALIAMFGFMIYMRKRDQEWFRKIIDDVTRSSSIKTCDELIPLRETTLTIPKHALVTKSVTKENFSEHYDSVVLFNVASNSTVLADQFKQLAMFSPPPPSADPDSYVTASKDINRAKNRYINILPYESTRVAIKNLHDPESDYINANFVKGANNEVEYIACQGPLAETSEDFWKMVFEHNVCVIAMVTNLEEKGKIKCHKYFPDLMEVMRYERIIIKCVQQAEFPVHTRRTFLVQENKGTVLKTVVHLHFREWPDFGCPKSPDLLISFCTTVRESATKCDEGLILVHCSAGVGRTGTLIALDILMQELASKGLINIFDTILQLRIQRINMVQTEGQYKYIHECVKEAILDLVKADGEIFDPIYQNLKKKAMEDENKELKEVRSSSEDAVVFRPHRESQRISKDILKSILSDPSVEISLIDGVDETEEITEL